MNIKGILAGKFRRVVLLCFDFVVFALVACAYFLGAQIFDHHATGYSYIWINAGILYVMILAARLIFRVYSSVWRYTRTLSYLNLVFADTFALIVSIAIVFIAGLDNRDIWLFAVISPMTTVLTISSRLCYRLVYKHRVKTHAPSAKQINVAIIGAGQLGAF